VFASQTLPMKSSDADQHHAVCRRRRAARRIASLPLALEMDDRTLDAKGLAAPRKSRCRTQGFQRNIQLAGQRFRGPPAVGLFLANTERRLRADG
jgi:hypothetical protein